MRITLRSPAAGRSAGDTAEVPDDYGRWLVDNGYAVEAEQATVKAEPKATDDSSARGDDAEDEQASAPRARRRKTTSRSRNDDAP